MSDKIEDGGPAFPQTGYSTCAATEDGGFAPIYETTGGILACVEPPTVAEAARVLLGAPYRILVPAFDAMDRVQGEGSDRVMATALRALTGEGKP